MLAVHGLLGHPQRRADLLPRPSLLAGLRDVERLEALDEGPQRGHRPQADGRVGFTRAAEMAMLGERIPAPQALEWGLINRVVADDAFAGEVAALRDRLAAGPTASYAGTKRQLNARVYAGMEEQLELEASIQEEMAASDDFLEGVSAFVQKREARFGGR